MTMDFVQDAIVRSSLPNDNAPRYSTYDVCLENALACLRRFSTHCLCDHYAFYRKTIMILALIVTTLDDLKRSGQHTTLIVVPPALVWQWKAEISKAAPQLRVHFCGHANDSGQLIIDREGALEIMMALMLMLIVLS